MASTSTIVVLILFLRFWKPKRVLNAARSRHHPQRTPKIRPQRRHHLQSLASLAGPERSSSSPGAFRNSPTGQTPSATIKIPVAGLHNIVQRVPPVVAKPTAEPAVFNLNWLAATGTGIFVAALLAGLLMGLGPKSLFAEFFKTLFNIRFTVITIAAMMALGFVTRYCGLDATLGLAFARTGALYPFFGTLIGWLGTASTGSDTSSNVLFGSLQKMTAQQIGVSPVAHGLGQLRRRRHGQNDRRAQHRRRQHRHPDLRPGGTHPPLRLPPQPRARLPRGPPRLPHGLRAPIHRPRAPLEDLLPQPTSSARIAFPVFLGTCFKYEKAPMRVCFLLKVRNEKVAQYKERHAHVWPEMLDALRQAGWRNYSIFLRPVASWSAILKPMISRNAPPP